MRSTPKVRRVLALSSIALCIALAVLFASGIAPIADTKPAGTLGINTVTKSVAEVAELSDGDGKADPGETLEYTISITGNASPTTGVTLNDTLSSLTTLTGTANILPIVKTDSYTAVGNTLLVIPDGPADLLSNDMDLDGGTLEVDGFGVNASATSAPGTTLTIANGGSVTVRADGSFDYDPPKGVNTAGTFYYRVKDGQGGTGVAQVNLTTSGMIWYVNPAAIADGDGRLTSPFKNLSTFNAANVNAANADNLPQNNDAIFFYSGAHVAPLTMRPGQKLIGQGASATIAAITGYTAPSGTSQLPATGGPSPAITSSGIGITISNNVTVRGITIGNTTGAKISGSNFGTLVIGNSVGPDVSLGGTGQAMNLSTGNFDTTSGFASVSSTSSTAQGISLTGIGGSVSFGSGALSGATGATLFISGGSVSVTYSGSITQATASQPAISVSSAHNGTLTFSTGTISATNGTGLQFDNADGTYNFNGTTTLNGGDAGIDILNGSTGTFSFGTGTSVTNPTGDAFNLEGVTASNANVTYSGSISKNNAGFAIDIDNHDANTITFQTGAISSTGTSNGVRAQNSNGGTVNFNTQVTLSTGSNAAVSLASNTGATINFNPAGTGFDITTTTGAGFSATGGGTVNVLNNNTGANGNSITSSGGAALNIANTTIGGSGLNFISISATGGANGIVLNNTGTSGGLNVIGDNGVANNGSGGTIQNMTGDGVSLTSTENLRLAYMNLQNNQGDGIGGSSVNGFVLNRMNITGNGNDAAADESGINISELTGTAGSGSRPTSISNSTISNNYEFEIQITNTSGNLVNFRLLNSTVSSNGATTVHGNLFNFLSLGTASMGLTVSGSTFDGNTVTGALTGTAVHVDASAGTINADIGSSNFIDNNAAVNMSTATNGNLTFNVHNNTQMTGNRSTGINVFSNGNATGTINGIISSNNIGTTSVANSGSALGRGVQVSMEGGGLTTLQITNNNIQQTAFEGISVTENVTAGTVNATITNNNVHDIPTSRGIVVQTTTAGTLNTSISGNTLTAIGGQPGDPNATVMRVNEAGGGTLNVTQTAPGSGGTGIDAVNGLASTKVAIGGTPQYGQPAPPTPTVTAPANFAETAMAELPQIDKVEIGSTEAAPITASLNGAVREVEPSDNAAAIEGVELPNVDDSRTSIGKNVFAFFAAVGNVISPTASAAPALAGENVTKGPFTLPASETVTIKFRVTVNDGPYAAGVDAITNTANITADGGINLWSNESSIELDAAPDLSVTVADNPATTEPGKTVAFVTTYANGNAANAQAATGVTVTQTVPANTTFNATASDAGWSCADGSPAGTSCTYSVGAVAANSSAALNFAVDVLPSLPAGAIAVTDSASILDDGANGADLETSDNASNTETTPIIGNWLGATSTDWHVASNWSNNTVPPAGNNISVPNVANQPEIISQDATVGLLTLSRDVTIGSGRTLTANGNVTLGTSVVDGAGTLELGTAAGIARTTGQVESALKKNFAAPGTFVFPVGTAGEYSPANVNVTTGTGSLTVRANTGTVPSTPPVDPAKTLQRYWSLDGSGITADLTFNYLQDDVAGTEGAYRLLRVAGGVPQSFANAAGCPASGSPCVDPVANTIFAAGISAFSDWTASELAPTSAPASITGQVFGYEGRVNGGALVVLTDDAGNVHYAKANTSGYFRFVNIDSGKTYMISVMDKRYRYTASVVNLDADVTGVMLVPQQP